MEELLLRPHHIRTLQDTIEIIKFYKAFGINPEEIYLNSSIKRFYDLYDPETFRTLMDLSHRVMDNPKIPIRFTLQADDLICTSCPYRSGCSIGNFTDIRQNFFERLGLILSPGNPPVEADQKAIKELKINTIRTYRASDFFK